MLSSRLLQKAAYIKPSNIRCVSSLIPTTHRPFTASNVAPSDTMIRSISDLNIPSPPTSIHPHVKQEGAKGFLLYTETDEAPALATFSLLPILTKVCILHVNST